ncbi:ATP-dependent DNA helicase [Frondihabitans australicus]|uniref:DNA 3'-5' helicase n=1 Tax=Frondihabitans australicus TaxID=386892 RepID=A0A495IGS7_9MICO|nr:ATP-dependent DNA helicase [Frondihabitans australicus]RKR74880.1 DNA helicase-2/ATP-dependent DNA helicase PcrA [Frondihabitans australicus]
MTTTGIRFSAVQLAEVLGRPRPTDEQAAVIEAPLEPALVVAGAGSGKTETMASRVVWLLANGLVEVSEILGLTFTRKAAGELAERIEGRIALLERQGLLPETHDVFDSPTVSTYNAFANALFRDNALSVGRENESQLLGEASAWQLARSLVVSSDDRRLASIGKSVDQITEAVLSISHALGENVADADDVSAMAERFGGVVDLPAGRYARADIDTAADTVRSLGPLLDLARRFDAEKARQGFVEFSDQVALALRVCETAPRVVDDYRERYRVVLLDEYQDTSVVQTRLLSRLFAGTGVMAVGDPHQSIYGFRGASAANLGRFPRDFGSPDGPTYTLSTSWRNPIAVLDAANVVVDPLSQASPVRVGRLAPRPGAPAGSVTTAFRDTLPDEATAVATWFEERLSVLNPDGTKRTAAILFRSRKTMQTFADALRERGVPAHVLGVGGLLSRPEIVDLMCCLRVLHDPSAGSELIRLMTGARWRIGLRDVARLRDVSRWLFDRDHAQKQLPESVRQRLRASVAAGEDGSLVDALDFVGAASETHSQLQGFSAEGLMRLRRLAAQLVFLRNRIGLDLVDLVKLVEQEMLLDIEAVANHGMAEGSAYLQAFADEVAGYAATSDAADLAGLLGWLNAAARRDDMGPRSDPSEEGVVQLVTVHGSKGLEWQLVAVPRLVEDELPGRPKSTSGWLSFGELPYEFRGDSAELPVLAWRGAADREELHAAIDAFTAENRERHLAEERRLAYVALTRAQDELMLSGSFWASQKKPRRPSRYLGELVEAGLVPGDALPGASEHDENPLPAGFAYPEWPFDPLGGRRAAVEFAAARVRAPGAAAAVGRWHDDIELLVRERDEARAGAGGTELPQRIPASRFKDYVDDPAAVVAALRRPLPERPYRATRLGTLFHTWVEERFRPTGRSEVLDADAFDIDPDEGESAFGVVPGAPVDPDDARRLAELQATFEKSEWAGLDAVDVELEIHLPLGARTVICKIDAVFERGDRYQVVDWKTGKAPRDEADLALKQLQLALYREAYASYRGIDPALIDAAFYFVADDAVLEPEHVSDRAELERLWEGVEGRL